MELIGWVVLAFAVFLLLFFTFTNGYNDASAVVATMIASGALSPRRAVMLAAVAGGMGILLGGSAVANTIAKMVTVPSDIRGVALIGAALAGAVAWNLTALRLRVPSSSGHALVGGLIGATLVAFGPDHVNWGQAWLADPLGHPIAGVAGVVFSLIVAPAIGFGGGFAVHRVAKVALRNAHFKMNRTIKRLQVVTSALLAFGHGSNVGQKAMGIFVVVLTASALTTEVGIPVTVRVVVLLVLTAGTLGGGWPIMKTVGRRIFKLEPVHALGSQVTSAAVLFGATAAGMPVSTPHVVATSVMGVGAAEQVSAVRWKVAKHILRAWGTTIPASACVAALIEAVLHFGAGL